jgi:hypothetical protein
VNHHQIESLLTTAGSRPEYAQLYIYDTDIEVQNRLSVIPSERDGVPNPDLVNSLIEMLDEHNPLCGSVHSSTIRFDTKQATTIDRPL